MAPKSKLTDDQIAEIIARKNSDPDLTNAILAEEYGVDASRISRYLKERVEQDKRRQSFFSTAAPAPLADIPHHLIEPSPLNPRKRFDPDKIAELADSVHVEGVLQNLVARPHPTKPGRYEIASGERRWRAVGFNIDRGLAAADLPMTVRVKELTDRQLIELAMAENMARADMTPLEEADSFQKLQGMGASKTEIAQAAGKSVRFVELRLKLLTGLCPQARAALGDGTITVEQARALTTAPLKQQAQHVENIIGKAHGYETVDDLRETIHDQMIPLVSALFNIQDSGLDIVTDDDTGEQFVTDAAKFAKLQTKALNAKIKELEGEGRLFVDVVGEGQPIHWFSEHQYPKAGKTKPFGCVIEIRRDRSVVVHDRRLRREDLEKQESAKRKEAARAAAKAGGSEEDEGAFSVAQSLTKAHIEHAQCRKTIALRLAVADQPLMAIRLACLALLGGNSSVRIRNGESSPGGQGFSLAMEVRIKRFASALNVKDISVKQDGCHVGSYRTIEKDELAIWKGLCAMSQGEVEEVFAALVAMRVGSFANYDLKPGDKPIAIAIAASLGVTDADVGFEKQDLEGLRRPELDAIVRAMGEGHDTKGMTAKALRDFLPGALVKDYVVPSLRFGTENQIKAAWEGQPIPDPDQPEEDDYSEDEEEDGDDAGSTFDEDEIDQEAAQ
ncbi:MAG: ParB/RepB/Spo0J family partition protein [Rhodospirillales bacterium]|jgi:ParB family chromosome partitioning protein